MNLARHAAVLWRFRAVTAAGLAVGLLLAILASYSVSFDGGPKLTPRGISVYTSESQILVTQRGFPEGRVVLPQAPVPTIGADGTTGEPKTEDGSPPLEFADPGRLMALADIYTQLIVSDPVRARIPQRPSAAEITAAPLPANSGSILPIISLSTIGPTAEAAHALNVNTFKALEDQLRDEAARNKISPSERVQLSTLKAPSPGTLLAGPSHTASILALLLCIIGTIAVTHLLESLRTRRRPAADLDELDMWDIDEGKNGASPASAEAADDRLAAFATTDWVVPTPRPRPDE